MINKPEIGYSVGIATRVTFSGTRESTGDCREPYNWLDSFTLMSGGRLLHTTADNYGSRETIMAVEKLREWESLGVGLRVDGVPVSEVLGSRSKQ